MVSAYNLVVDITAKNITIADKEFRDIISPCLTYLDALKGAFDRKPCSVTFYPSKNSTGASVRCVLMISVGKSRAYYLQQLYQAMVRLIEFELPDFEILSEVEKFEFS